MQKQNVLSFLKLRASWGTLGNERIGNYPSFGIISFGNALFYQNNVAVAQQTAAQIQYAIKDISWEKTASTDIGGEVRFFNDKLSIIADYYNKITSDILVSVPLPSLSG